MPRGRVSRPGQAAHPSELARSPRRPQTNAHRYCMTVALTCFLSPKVSISINSQPSDSSIGSQESCSPGKNAPGRVPGNVGAKRRELREHHYLAKKCPARQRSSVLCGRAVACRESLGAGIGSAWLQRQYFRRLTGVSCRAGWRLIAAACAPATTNSPQMSIATLLTNNRRAPDAICGHQVRAAANFVRISTAVKGAVSRSPMLVVDRRAVPTKALHR